MHRQRVHQKADCSCPRLEEAAHTSDKSCLVSICRLKSPSVRDNETRALEFITEHSDNHKFTLKLQQSITASFKHVSSQTGCRYHGDRLRQRCSTSETLTFSAASIKATTPKVQRWDVFKRKKSSCMEVRPDWTFSSRSGCLLRYSKYSTSDIVTCSWSNRHVIKKQHYVFCLMPLHQLNHKNNFISRKSI